MQRPGADAAHQEGVAELRLARGFVLEVAERAVEGVDSRRHARVDHARDGVVPQILLEEHAFGLARDGVFEHAVGRVPAADAGGLHAARRGEVGGAETHAVHARAGHRDLVDILDALRGFEQRMDQDRASDAVLGFELRQELIDVVDVPRALDLGHDDDIELVADGADDLDHVVEHPRAVQRVDAGPQRGGAEIHALGGLDEAGARRLLRVGRDRVLQIAAEHIDLLRRLRKLAADLLDLRREEMDHPLRPDREFAQRRGRADRERAIEMCG